MKISNKLTNRIKAYSAMGTAVLAADATAAIVYTDISPDFNGGGTSSYLLDLNNDAVNDFEIYAFSSSASVNLYIKPLIANNFVLGSGSSGFAYPFALVNGANIGAAATGSWFNNGFSTGYLSLNYGSGSFGNWISVTDRYLGLSIRVGGNTYYGWCRMDVNANGSAWVVKDYAYENTPNTPILAGAMGSPIVTANGVSGITGTDVGNALDGTDLEVTFNKAADETTVANYRVMAVKSGGAGSFDLTAAQAVVAANYVAIAPNASATYTQAFTATGTDVDGDPITVNQPYKIFVLSEADGTVATVDSLAGPSGDVTLINDIGLEEFLSDPVEVYGNGKTVVVDLQKSNTSKGELTIMDMGGKVYYNGELVTGNRHEIPMGQCRAGVYIASLKLENQTISRKIVLN